MSNQPNFTIPDVYHSTAFETISYLTGHTQEPIGAKLLTLFCMNNSSSDGYIHIFDGYQAPNTGDVPFFPIPIKSLNYNSFTAGAGSVLPLTKGIVIALSSTAATYTPISSSLWTVATWIV